MYIFKQYLYFLEDDIAATGNNDRIEMNIYAEDEEMTPAIDIENEEVEDDIEFDIENEETSEDEIEFYINDETSEYERMMMEFDGSNEDDDREEISNEESDEEMIIDKPFSNEQMPQTFGEFAPYFKNITESLMFCWMQKHRICKYMKIRLF